MDSLLLDRYYLHDIYPYPESVQLEFKKSFHINQLDKYRETVCAFLNTVGGHIIFGITNDCVIIGNYLTEKDIDSIMLFADSIYNILKTVDGNNIKQGSITVKFNKIAKDLYIIIFTCIKYENIKYQFVSGESWIRMNASNKKVNENKLYQQQQLDIIKQRLYVKHQKEIKDTVITVSNILLRIQNKEYELKLNNRFNYYLIFFSILSLFSIVLFYKVRNYYMV
jgi:predicted HTH transcriptional regulator